MSFKTITLVGPFTDGPSTFNGQSFSGSRGHFSESGWATQDVISNGIVAELASYNPDYVLLNIGRKNLLNGESVADTAANILALQDLILASFVGKLFAGGPVPNTDDNTDNAAVDDIVRPAMQANPLGGSRLFYIPFQPQLQRLPDYWTDLFGRPAGARSHPTDHGYNVYGTWYGMGFENVPSGSTIMPVGDSQMKGQDGTTGGGPRCQFWWQLINQAPANSGQGMLL